MSKKEVLVSNEQLFSNSHSRSLFRLASYIEYKMQEEKRHPKTTGELLALDTKVNHIIIEVWGSVQNIYDDKQSQILEMKE